MRTTAVLMGLLAFAARSAGGPIPDIAEGIEVPEGAQVIDQTGA